MINYEALYIFDAKVGVKGTYNVNETLNSKTDAIVPLFFISFAIVSISSGPPFLKSCVSLLHSNVFKLIKIIPSEYCIRVMLKSYACGLKTSMSRIKD